MINYLSPILDHILEIEGASYLNNYSVPKDRYKMKSGFLGLYYGPVAEPKLMLTRPIEFVGVGCW